MKIPYFQLLSALFVIPVILLTTGCKKTSSVTPATAPTVTTNTVFLNVTSTTAQSGGVITSTGDATITANGICYSTTNKTPTTTDSKTSDALSTAGTTTTTFTSQLSALTPGTLYYIRAYATNSAGTGYGSVVQFTTSADLTAVESAVTTFAGSGTAGFMDGTGTVAQFNNPQGIAVDKNGNIFVSDTYNNVIREITPAGVVTTIAGTGAVGYTDGPAATATFYAPKGLVFDAQGNLFVADYGNNVIRKISTAGVVSTYSGNGQAGYNDTSTPQYIEYRAPSGLAFDASGNLYVADRGNNLIRKITTAGVVSTLAGTNNSTYVPGYLNGTDLAVAFHTPNGIAMDASNNVLVADQANSAIRKVTTSAGVTTTVVGSPTQSTIINIPTAVAVDKTGNLFITDEGGRVLEYTTNNILYNIAGTLNVSGFSNGSGTAALFNNPQGIAVDGNGVIYVADQNNNCIRKVVMTLVH